MKFVNLESGIIFDGYEFDDVIEMPRNKYVASDGTVNDVEIIAVDDALVASIIILNKKGYKTLFSCAGHVEDGFNNGYIYFKDDIFAFDYVTHPKDIDLFNNKDIFIENTTTIRAKRGCDENHELTIVELTEAINDFNTAVLKWALSLPKFEELKIKKDGTVQNLSILPDGHIVTGKYLTPESSNIDNDK